MGKKKKKAPRFKGWFWDVYFKYLARKEYADASNQDYEKSPARLIGFNDKEVRKDFLKNYHVRMYESEVLGVRQITNIIRRGKA